MKKRFVANGVERRPSAGGRQEQADDAPAEDESARVLSELPRLLSRATLVKESPVRRTWRVARSGEEFFVKEFLPAASWSRLVSLLRGSACRREWRNLRRFHQDSVRTPQPVGMVRVGGHSFLVVRAIPGGIDLAQAWRLADSRLKRRALIHAVADLFASAHEAGAFHGDEHPRNILIARADSDQPVAHFVDPANARFKTRRDVPLCVESLARLNQWFRLRASRCDRLRFLRAYLRHRGFRASDAAPIHAAPWTQAVLTGRIAEETRRQAARLHAKRDRRIFGRNSYFDVISLGPDARAYVALKHRSRDLFPQPSAPDMTPEQWAGRLDASATVPEFAMERTERRRAGSDDARPERLRHAFRTAHLLHNRDIPCRRALALIEQRGALGPTYRLWVDRQPVSKSLADVVGESDTPPGLRSCYAARLARLVDRLARAGFRVDDAVGDTFGFDSADGGAFVDNAAGLSLDPRSGDGADHRLLAAMADWFVRQPNARRTDAMRFLKNVSPTEYKALWRKLRGLPHGRQAAD